MMGMDVELSKKGPKTAIKHENQIGHGNIFPKGVQSKSSSIHETRSSHSDSRSPYECTLHYRKDRPGIECMHVFADVRCDECYLYV